MKKIRYAFEALLLYALFGFFKVLPVQAASNVGGFIGRTIGPRLASNRKVLRHLKMAFPDLKEDEYRHIMYGMWDNLGRVIAEYPHLKVIARRYTEFVKHEDIEALLSQDRPMIFIGAHLGNWEINGTALFMQYNHKTALTFRAPNNPWVAKLLNKIRTLDGTLKAYAKSRVSGRYIVQTLKDNGTVGILIDQKHNQGVEASFFNHPAMTNPIFVQLAQKYNCQLIPFRSERLKGAHFRITAYPAINLFEDDGTARPVDDVIKDTHSMLEGWIRERPEQWLWLHRRWKYKSK